MKLQVELIFLINQVTLTCEFYRIVWETLDKHLKLKSMHSWVVSVTVAQSVYLTLKSEKNQQQFYKLTLLNGMLIVE